MARHWYARVIGEELGPLSDQQLQDMVLRKQLTRDDLVKVGEDGQWAAADKIKGLFQGSLAPSVKYDPVADLFDGQSIRPQSGPTPQPAARNTAATNPRLASCLDCQNMVSRSTPRCPHCGTTLSKSRVVAGLLAWFFGLAGLHKFYLGNTKQGVFYLAATLIVAPILTGRQTLIWERSARLHPPT
jgi:hypothetical protein